MASCENTTTSPEASLAGAGGGETTISAVHPDIIRAHILSRLDGPDLAAASCASSELHALSADESLWRDACAAMWPSVAADARLSRLVADFPAGHRSFFSDCFPILDSVPSRKFDPTFTSPTPGLISAVDIFYKDRLIFSKVIETETVTDWFLNSPFLVDLIEPKDTVPTTVSRAGAGGAGAWLKHLEENVTLSWIAIDPARRRAANLSSRRAVSAQRHWLTGEVQLKYAAIMAADGGHVQCSMVVTCGGGGAGKEEVGGERMHVREVGMHVEDMEGRHLSGRESLVVLGNAVGGGRRRSREKGSAEAKERFEAYLEMRRESRERRLRREKALDLACIVTGVSIFVTFWSFILFR